MRYLPTFLIFFILLGINIEKAFSQIQEPESLEEIFKPYIGIIGNDSWFENWNAIEYFRFLAALNKIYADTKKSSDTIDDYNEYQKFQHQKEVISVFNEIFGGIRLQKSIIGLHIYFIPENLLDLSIDNKPSRISRHDGALIELKNGNIIIHKILEAKLNNNNYDKRQTLEVLRRWKKSGIIIANKKYSFRNIHIKVGRDIIPITEYLNTVDTGDDNDTDDDKKKYSSLLTLYTEYNLSQDTGISQEGLLLISSKIFESLYLEGISKVLLDMNIKFIDRILFLLKQYIRIYGRLPSLGRYYSKLDGITSDDMYLNYFKIPQNTHDLVLSLYSIRKSSLFFSLLKERIDIFFSHDEIVQFFIADNENGYVTFDGIFDKSINIVINFMKELFGQEHYEQFVEGIINDNKLHIVSVSDRNYTEEELNKKLSVLLKYFSLEQSKEIILNNLKNFVAISLDQLKLKLDIVNEAIFENLQTNDLFFYYIKSHFFQILHKINLEEFSKKLSVIEAMFKIDRLQVFKLMIDHDIRDMKNIIYNFNIFLDCSESGNNKYFPTISDGNIRQLFLNHLKVLENLNMNQLDKIIRTFIGYFKFSDVEIERLLIQNFRYLHIINPKNLLNKTKFIKTFLKKHSTNKKDRNIYIKNVMIAELYNISLLNLDNAIQIHAYLRNYFNRPLDSLFLYWIIEQKQHFDDITLKKIKDAINFLETNSWNHSDIEELILQLDSIDCLDKDFLTILFEVIKEEIGKIPDSINTSIKSILLSCNIDKIFRLINNDQYRRSFIFLTQEYKKEMDKTKIREQISSVISSLNVCIDHFSSSTPPDDDSKSN